MGANPFLASSDAKEVMLSLKVLAMTWPMWPWWVMIPIEDLTDVTLAIEDTEEDEEGEEEVKKVKKWKGWWRFACGDVYFVMWNPCNRYAAATCSFILYI